MFYIILLNLNLKKNINMPFFFYFKKLCNWEIHYENEEYPMMKSGAIEVGPIIDGQILAKHKTKHL